MSNTIEENSNVNEEIVMKEEACSCAPDFIEKGDTAGSRGDLYNDIKSNLDQISSLAEMARTAYQQEENINPCIMATYCSVFLEMSNLIFVRLESLRKYDLGLEKQSNKTD
jgi:hypothetical protein